jgi:hypothetical protein
LTKQNTYPPPLFAEGKCLLGKGPSRDTFLLVLYQGKNPEYHSIFFGYLLEPDVEYGLSENVEPSFNEYIICRNEKLKTN